MMRDKKTNKDSDELEYNDKQSKSNQENKSDKSFIFKADSSSS